MKKSKILAFVVAATLAVSAIPTASAVVTADINLSQPYEYYIGNGYWARAEYILGGAGSQGDAATRSKTNIALGMTGTSFAYTKTECGSKSYSVTKTKTYDGWVDTGYVKGELNGTVQDDIAKETQHTFKRYMNEAAQAKLNVEKQYI